MLPTLEALCRRLGDDLTPVVPSTAPAVEVSAVHVSELADPTRYLEGGELLLTTGLAFEVSELWCRAYVERLVDAGVAGLAFGVGPVHDIVPTPLSRAAQRARLPLLQVPPPTPFLTISRAYWSMLAESGQRELVAQLSAHRGLIAAALSTQPVAAVLRRLAAAVGGWAAHLSPDGDVIAMWPRRRGRELAQAIGKLDMIGLPSAGSLAIGDDDVVVQPLGGNDQLLGYLAVGCPRPIPATAQQVTMTAVALLSLEAVHAQRVRAERRLAPSVALRLLLDGEVDAALHIAAATGITIDAGRVRPAVLAGMSAADLLDAVELLPAARHRVVLLGHVDADVIVLLRDDEDAGDWLRAVARRVPSARGVLGPAISTPELPGALTRLRGTAAQHTDPGIIDLTERVDLDQMLADPRVRGWADSRLAPVAHSPDLLATLAAFLHERGEWEATARALGVHRHTVRNRVTRIEQLLGSRVDDADAANELWLALRVSGRS